MSRIKRKIINLFSIILISFIAGALFMYSIMQGKHTDSMSDQSMVKEEHMEQMENSSNSEMMIELPEDVQNMTEEQQ